MSKHLLLVLYLCTNTAFAQQLLIKVDVDTLESSFGIPILLNGQISAQTDVYGQCALNNVAANDTIVVDALAFQRFQHIVSEGDSLVNIRLTKKTYELDEIQITPLTVSQIMAKAFAHFPKYDNLHVGIFIRQYTGESGDYRKLTEGYGEVAIPTMEKTKRNRREQVRQSQKYFHKNQPFLLDKRTRTIHRLCFRPAASVNQIIYQQGNFRLLFW